MFSVEQDVVLREQVGAEDKLTARPQASVLMPIIIMCACVCVAPALLWPLA